MNTERCFCCPLLSSARIVLVLSCTDSLYCAAVCDLLSLLVVCLCTVTHVHLMMDQILVETTVCSSAFVYMERRTVKMYQMWIQHLRFIPVYQRCIHFKVCVCVYWCCRQPEGMEEYQRVSSHLERNLTSLQEELHRMRVSTHEQVLNIEITNEVNPFPSDFKIYYIYVLLYYNVLPEKHVYWSNPRLFRTYWR